MVNDDAPSGENANSESSLRPTPVRIRPGVGLMQNRPAISRFALLSVILGILSFGFLAVNVMQNFYSNDGLTKIMTANPILLGVSAALSVVALIFAKIGSGKSLKTAAVGKTFGAAAVVSYIFVIPAVMLGDMAEVYLAIFIAILIMASPVLLPAGILVLLFRMIQKARRKKKEPPVVTSSGIKDLYPWRKHTDLSFLSVFSLLCSAFIVLPCIWVIWFAIVWLSEKIG